MCPKSMMMALSLGLVLHNPTSEMLHPYPELRYNNKRTYAFSMPGNKVVLWVRSQSEFVPRPLLCLPLKFFFEKKKFLFCSSTTPFSRLKSIGLLLPCPFSYFLKQGHAFPVRPKQRRGTCEPSTYPLTSRFGADSARLFWDCRSRTTKKHQTFRGIPFCHFYYSGKKLAMMCLLRHGTGQQGVLYFK